jgi:hypothetical protein
MQFPQVFNNIENSKILLDIEVLMQQQIKQP